MPKLLIENGDQIPLTVENKEKWMRLAKRTRLSEAKLPLEMIRKGLSEVVPLPLIDLCTSTDLEWRVCGKPLISIPLLKRHTEYSPGLSPTAPHVIFFWQVLESFTQEQRRAFVQFAWAQERLPANDQEFIRTSTRMLIKPSMGTGHPDREFPKADTCFFNLTLPEYTSIDACREKLLTAIYTDPSSMNADVPQEGRPDFEFA